MSDFQKEREEMCEIGRRMYSREFVAAHEGNLSIRLPDGNFLCTPTMHCKGRMAPKDLCIVDHEMNMLTGGKATSEIRLHLEIYRQREDIRAVVHSHPPHATAFAVANRPFPCATLAEPDLFLGEVALAPFQVPGTMEFAESVAPFVQDTNAVILSNHGVVTYAEDLETAFWMTEILESACKTVILSMSIGGPQQLSKEQGRELARARKNYGFNDARDLMASDCDVRGHSLFHQHLGLQEVDLDFFSKHRKRMDSGSTD